MTAFERAWQVVKMARHILHDDVEFWDLPESRHHGWNYGRFGSDPPEGYEELPKFQEREQPMPEDFGWSNTDKFEEVESHDDIPEDERAFGHNMFGTGSQPATKYKTTPRPKEEWRSFRADNVDSALDGLRGDGYVYGRGWNPDPELPEGRDEPLTWDEMQAVHQQYYDDDENWGLYYPWSGGENIAGERTSKLMMTPNQYLDLAKPGHNEERAKGMAEVWRNNPGRTPVGIPQLQLQLRRGEDRFYPDEERQPLSGPQSFGAVAHEGRHRMAALRAMGLGDKPVPVLVGLDEGSKHSFGVGHSGRNMAFEEALPHSFIWPEEWKKREDKPMRVPSGAVSGEWGLGEYDDLR